MPEEIKVERKVKLTIFVTCERCGTRSQPTADCEAETQEPAVVEKYTAAYRVCAECRGEQLALAQRRLRQNYQGAVHKLTADEFPATTNSEA